MLKGFKCHWSDWITSVQMGLGPEKQEVGRLLVAYVAVKWLVINYAVALEEFVDICQLA